ncbi:glycosyltransferase [Janibacter sp. GXQ6167]|uniref:glycosyltransferase n=1 Tax=Janibacter sp. GXQ6167 TaxID=3240791 RepID=UPI0035236D1C
MPELPRDRPRILLMSSNGTGMGHLSRLIGYARGIGDRADVSFLSLSLAAPVVADLGYDYEYLPSQDATQIRPAAWRRLFLDRLSDTLRRLRPDLVVFDGAHPYVGIDVVRERFPQTRWVWSRRAFWKPGIGLDQLAKTAWFDAVLEPGDLAEAADRGATVGEPSHHINPVTMLNPGDLGDRAADRAALGLPADGPLALVSLGTADITDRSRPLGAVVAALRDHGVGVCLTQSALVASASGIDGVHLVRDFPIARRYAAFDIGVTEAGYNAFHEGLRLGLPSLFIPRATTARDDQQARARFAAEAGWSLVADDPSAEEAHSAVAELLERGEDLARAAQAADPGNGAPQAGDFLINLVEGGAR